MDIYELLVLIINFWNQYSKIIKPTKVLLAHPYQPIFWHSTGLECFCSVTSSLPAKHLALRLEDCETDKPHGKCSFSVLTHALLFLLEKEEASATEIRKLGWRESNFPVLKIVSWKAALLRKAVRFHSCFQESPCSPQMFFRELFNSLKLKHLFLTSQTLFIVLNCWPECTITLWNKSPLNHVYFSFGYYPWKLVWIFCMVIRLMLHTIILRRVYPENNPRLAVVVLKAIFLC